jgi:hypothetical protein
MRLVEAMTAFSRGFRWVHRNVGVLQQHLSSFPVSGEKADPNRCSDPVANSRCRRKWFADRDNDAFSNPFDQPSSDTLGCGGSSVFGLASPTTQVSVSRMTLVFSKSGNLGLPPNIAFTITGDLRAEVHDLASLSTPLFYPPLQSCPVCQLPNIRRKRAPAAPGLDIRYVYTEAVTSDVVGLSVTGSRTVNHFRDPLRDCHRGHRLAE